ncbi:SGNH/GDSL hydrolase family protein [Streptomyces sp. NPDC002073]
MTASSFALALPLAAVLLAATACTPAPAHSAGPHPAGPHAASAQAAGPWRSAWSASLQAPAHTTWFENWSEGGFDRHTLRQVVRAGAEGQALRVRLSNAYGARPLRIAGAAVARSAGGAAVAEDSVRTVRFGGAAGFTVHAGRQLLSDPVALPVKPGEQLAVTLWFAAPTGPATFHNLALTTSYRAAGNHVGDPAATAFTQTSRSWYYVAGVDVQERAGGAGRPRTVVAFGDSLTDGLGATFGADRRYPDRLAGRLAAAGRPLAVLNEGISGNKVLNDSVCYGERGTARFRRDVLGHPDVRTVIVLEGTNDIIQAERQPARCTTPSPKVGAAEIIAGHREFVRQARARGVRILGATIPPYRGYPDWTPRGEGVRNAVNDWIRTGGAYDGVVDFDRALADPADPGALREEFRSGDRLHLNDAGNAAMAAAVDLNAL